MSLCKSIIISPVKGSFTCEFKMAANQEIIKRIAQEAIENINRMTALLESNRNVPSETQNSSASSSSNSALSELQRRFPTLNSRSSCATAPRSRSSRSARFRPYQTSAAPGRPVKSSIVTRDVIIIEKGHEHMPSKTEKVQLERKRRVVSGFDVDRNWEAEELHKQLSYLLKDTEMEGLRFEIVKNCGGTLVTPNIPSGKKIDANLLFKSISPTGHIIIRLLDYLPRVDKEIEDMLSKSAFGFDKDSETESENDVIVVESKHQPSNSSSTKTANNDTNQGDGAAKEQSTRANISSEISDEYPDIDCPFDIQSIIDKAKALNLHDPVEVLRFLQQEINEGRELDMSTYEETLEGNVNLITVNRNNLLQSTFSELEFIDSYRCTFRVDFMGEECVDQGGPRKQWIRLINQAIKKKYFDQGLRKFLSKDYFFVGLMIAVAMLQNGQMPTYIEEEVLQDIISSGKNPSPCVHEMQRGLEKLGMLSALRQLPMLQHLLRPGAEGKLTVPVLLHLLKANFSEEGSNASKYEKQVYELFVRYIREVASGRRSCGEKTLELSNILEFVTGASNEPALGFVMPPRISFVIPNEITTVTTQIQTGQDRVVEGNFIPTAHTCGNILSLPRPTQQFCLPSTERLFSLYDLAFSQDYFGKI